MPSADCASFDSFVSEMSLPPFFSPRSPEVEILNEPTSWPTISSPNTRNQPAAEEILVPGKNWEYVADYPLYNLKPHPLQKNLFAGLSAAGIEELAEDIQKRGLQNPLEILPDGTLINGHQRFIVYKWLGRKQIPVYIRRDFHDQSETAVEEHIVQDNLQRKHLHPLEIARCYLHLRKLCHEQEADGKEPTFTLKELRGDLARRFDISGRTLDRYLAALKAPEIIQNACIQGRIRFNQVSKIGELSQERIQSMLAEIEATGDLPAVVTKYAQQRRGVRVDPVIDFIASGRQLRKKMMALVEELDDIPAPCRLLQLYRPVLKESIFQLAQLLYDLKNPTTPSLSEVLLHRDAIVEDIMNDLHREEVTLT